MTDLIDLAIFQSTDGGSSTTVRYIQYTIEDQMFGIMDMMEKELSEPYSIFTYRYFIHNWPNLCFLVRKAERTSNLHYYKIWQLICQAMVDKVMVGTIVCKAERTRKGVYRGYIAMLAVNQEHRKYGIGM